MPAEVTLAAISLLVAGFAFVIAMLQLVQSIYGPVEGYRKCAESVIGAWSLLRHRHRKLSEWRVEVEYSTPHFSVLSSNDNLSDWGSAEKAFGPTYDLIFHSRLRPDYDVDYTTVKKYEKVLQSSLSAKSDETRFMQPAVPPSQSPNDIEKNKPSRQDTLVPRRKNELRVSWLLFLEAIHETYIEQYEQSGILKPKEPIPPGLKPRDLIPPGLNIAAVSFRQWSWDFMPPEVTRPLATSTLRDIILLALRLNIDWKLLNLSNKSFLADGNGFTITSEKNEGLGILFRFASSVKEHTLPIFAPSKIVDKTMFGIVPGCQSLVKRDFPLVGDDRKEDFKQVFEELGINSKVSAALATGYREEPRREAMILLSDFIPVHNCPILYNYLPGFRTVRPWTALHSWSGRAAFWELLANRVKERNSAAQASLEACIDKLGTLNRDWPDDFRCNWRDSIIQGSRGDDPKMKIKFSDACREVFDWTTETLKKTWSRDDTEDNRYVDLVAAHCVMAYHAVITAGEKYDNDKDDWKGRYGANEELRKSHEEQFGSEVGYGWPYHVAREYVANVRDGVNSVAKYLSDKRCRLSKDEVEASWWIMMVRGIAWNMSTTGAPVLRNRQQPQYRWTPGNVPSKFYYIGTPVWIA